MLAADGGRLWRVRRWWVRHFREWTPKPISVPQMLALQAAHRASALHYVVTLAGVLRAVLPRRWWYRVTGDPVALILALGRVVPSLQEKVLASLVMMPGAKESAVLADDPVEAIRRAQRVAVYGAADQQPRGSLAAAALVVRAAYGDAWYWNPERWPTADGYVPFAVCLTEYAGLQALDARRRLEVADGYALANTKDPRRARQQLEQIAYPSDPLVH